MMAQELQRISAVLVSPRAFQCLGGYHSHRAFLSASLRLYDSPSQSALPSSASTLFEPKSAKERASIKRASEATPPRSQGQHRPFLRFDSSPQGAYSLYMDELVSAFVAEDETAIQVLKRQLADQGIVPSLWAHNIRIASLVRRRDFEGVEANLRTMVALGIKLSPSTYNHLLRLYASKETLHQCESVLLALNASGLAPNITTYEILGEFYTSIGDTRRAQIWTAGYNRFKNTCNSEPRSLPWPVESAALSFSDRPLLPVAQICFADFDNLCADP